MESGSEAFLNLLSLLLPLCFAKVPIVTYPSKISSVPVCIWLVANCYLNTTEFLRQRAVDPSVCLNSYPRSPLSPHFLSLCNVKWLPGFAVCLIISQPHSSLAFKKNQSNFFFFPRWSWNLPQTIFLIFLLVLSLLLFLLGGRAGRGECRKESNYFSSPVFWCFEFWKYLPTSPWHLHHLHCLCCRRLLMAWKSNFWFTKF